MNEKIQFGLQSCLAELWMFFTGLQNFVQSTSKCFVKTDFKWCWKWSALVRIWVRFLLAMTCILTEPCFAAPPDWTKVEVVSIVGTHHMETTFNVPTFAVDGNSSGPIGREGGGGASDCCILIPRHWRPGLSVDVRWSINDWTNVEGGGMFRAKVPVEQYDTPDDLIVHIFPGGKVRVRVGRGLPGVDRKKRFVGVLEPATQGVPIDEMFSKEEIEASIRERKQAERGGNSR